MAAIGWGFCTLWVGGLTMFTYLYARDGGFGQFDQAVEAGVLMLFWMGGLALMANLLTKPLVHLTVRRSGSRLVRTWPWGRRVETLSAAVLRDLSMGHDRDSDGDPYYRLWVVVPSGGEVVLCESSDLSRVKAVQDDVLARL